MLRARCTTVASARSSQDQPRAVPPKPTRRGVLLGLGAGLVGLVSSANSAQAAQLSDLVKPLVVSMDANGDGVLSVDEVRGAIQRSSGQAAPRQIVVEDVMAPVDFNNDGEVSVDEFSRGMALELGVDERWMRVMERDGGAGVSREELAAGLGDLGRNGTEVLRVAFEMADQDRNGRLNAAEAQRAMNMIATGLLGDYGEGL
ncbi:hypothetical protein HYH02_005462 [Chlamydomonas schloesseri]|uniref:EF-hand domain-containing protein n=1 Tax=Chlamydomonas schloesseri TaxID=2026947 RepID=A0A835WKW5_9CHLO|nr:hypothetical protein HYH02_005462 [Chlamydomonas schloesseri]|eukprot:KAG2449306.1 hypothetical protein HYH02_005462 [Chlamydomonas schloesseri]